MDYKIFAKSISKRSLVSSIDRATNKMFNRPKEEEKTDQLELSEKGKTFYKLIVEEGDFGHATESTLKVVSELIGEDLIPYHKQENKKSGNDENLVKKPTVLAAFKAGYNTRAFDTGSRCLVIEDEGSDCFNIFNFDEDDETSFDEVEDYGNAVPLTREEIVQFVEDILKK